MTQIKDLKKLINEKEKIDVKENIILNFGNELLSILLKDQTTKKNIIWATDNYEKYGYSADENMTIKSITGRYGQVIKPRTKKSKDEQQSRIRNKAEVFTPSWICNKQNNLIDEAWFGFKNVFNIEEGKTWITNTEKINFAKSGKPWQAYVTENRLEITCGEAPYLVSRYDTVSGDIIEIKDRIGLLDRKLRVISENVDSEPEWVKHAIIAFKSIYGYDWQGDNVLLARENLLLTFIDYYTDKFVVPPIKEYLIEIATIISWNIWQMDGLKFVIPNSCRPLPKPQLSFFEDDKKLEECPGCLKNNINKHNGIYCKVKNWETGRAIKFVSLLKNKA